MFPSTAFVLRVVALLSFTAFTAARTIQISRRSIHSSHNGVAVVDTTKLVHNMAHIIEKLVTSFSIYERNIGKKHSLFEGIKYSRKRETGSEPLTDFYYQYYSMVTIGTPPKPFTVRFDTVSSEFFIPGSCVRSCEGYAHYDPSASSTSVKLHKNYYYSLGNNASVVGGGYTDVVEIAGFVADRQALAAINAYTPSRNHTLSPVDGLMGMGFKSMSVLNASTVFQNLVDENEVASSMFAFKLCSSNGSMLTLGGADPNLYNGSITWAPLSDLDSWQTAVNGISVDGKEVLGPTHAVFDTTAIQILGDHDTIKQLFDNIHGAKPWPNLPLYSIPCDYNSTISINIAGKDIKIPPAVFKIGFMILNGENVCIAGAAWSQSLTGKFLVLGAVFLESTYSIWDFDYRRMGFADLR